MSGENNTVTISLQYYNELRDFQKSIEARKIAVVNSYHFGYEYYSKEEFESEVVEGIRREKTFEIKKLKADIKVLMTSLKKINSKKGCFICGTIKKLK